MRGALKLGVRRNKRRVALVLLMAAVAAVAARVAASAPAPTTPRVHPFNASSSLCGVQRWAVKTMTDPAANRVAVPPRASALHVKTERGRKTEAMLAALSELRDEVPELRQRLPSS